jgi:hypothetical protein
MVSSNVHRTHGFSAAQPAQIRGSLPKSTHHVSESLVPAVFFKHGRDLLLAIYGDSRCFSVISEMILHIFSHTYTTKYHFISNNYSYAFGQCQHSHAMVLRSKEHSDPGKN